MSNIQDFNQLIVYHKIAEDYEKLLYEKYKDCSFMLKKSNINDTYFSMDEKYSIAGFTVRSGTVYVRNHDTKTGTTRLISLKRVVITY